MSNLEHQVIPVTTIDDLQSFPIYEIEGVKHIFIDLHPEKQFRTMIHMTMHLGENYCSFIEAFKLKAWCERNGYGLCLYGIVNKLPLLSLIADRLLLDITPEQTRDIYERNNLYYEDKRRLSCGFIKNNFEEIYTAQKALFHGHLPGLLHIANFEISDDEIIERFAFARFYMLESGYRLYEKMKEEGLEKDITVTEIKRGGVVTPVMYHSLEKVMSQFGIDLVPENWRDHLLARAGTNHMAISVLGALDLNWTWFCHHGSSILLSFFPVKLMSISGEYLPNDFFRKLSMMRYGEFGKAFPSFRVGGSFEFLKTFDPNLYKEFQKNFKLPPLEIERQRQFRMELTPEEEADFRSSGHNFKVLKGS